MRKHEKIEKARYLRQVETEVEKLLWEELRNNKLGEKFRRQHPIGVFVLDFYCPRFKLAIELDGAYHFKEEGRKYDQMRTELLESNKIKVLRFKNEEILNNMSGTLRTIEKHITL
jgi:very-short-patch-repair endonuclease